MKNLVLFLVINIMSLNTSLATPLCNLSVSPTVKEKIGEVIGEGSEIGFEGYPTLEQAKAEAIKECIEEKGERCAISKEFCERPGILPTFNCKAIAIGSIYRTIQLSSLEIQQRRCELLTNCLSDLASNPAVTPEQYQKYLELNKNICL